MDAPPPLPESSIEPTAAAPMSLAARLTNVFATPAEVFDQVKGSPPAAANWVVPALLFMLVSWVGAWLVFSQPAIRQQLSELTQQAIEKQIQRSHVSQEQADRNRATGEKYAGMAQKFSAFAGPPFAAFASPFFWGLVFWFAGGRALRAQVPFMKAVEVAGLCNMVSVLGVAVKDLLILAMSNLFASPSAALLLKDFNAQNPLHIFFATLNVMVFWVLAVRAIGLTRLSGGALVKSFAWLFGLWALYAGCSVGLAAFSSAFMNR
jgi:hypothetical protein